MDMILYIICAILYAVLAILIIGVPVYFNIQQKKDHKDMEEYLHRWQIESYQNDKNAQRILDEIQKTNKEFKKISKENSLFLRMIFERVDRPPVE
jgi:uncharacterized protein HemX